MNVVCGICAAFVAGAAGQLQYTLKADQMEPLYTTMSLLTGSAVPYSFQCPATGTSAPYTCTSAGVVDAISLYNMGTVYSGMIASQIGLLTGLTKLDLRYNAISGTVPGEIGFLSSLKILLLYGNRLTGPLPETLDNFGPNLSLCGLTQTNSPTNCFDCPLPPQFACSIPLQCRTDCPKASTASPATTAATTTTTTTTQTQGTVPPAAYSTQSTHTSDTLTLPATDPTTTTARPTAAATTTQPITTTTTTTTLPTTETTSTANPTTTTAQMTTAATATANVSALLGPAATTLEMRSFVFMVTTEADASSGSKDLTTIIIVSCIAVVVVPLLIFLGYAFARSRYRRAADAESGAGTQLSSVPPAGGLYGSLPPAREDKSGIYDTVTMPLDIDADEHRMRFEGICDESPFRGRKDK